MEVIAYLFRPNIYWRVPACGATKYESFSASKAVQGLSECRRRPRTSGGRVQELPGVLATRDGMALMTTQPRSILRELHESKNEFGLIFNKCSSRRGEPNLLTFLLTTFYFCNFTTDARLTFFYVDNTFHIKDFVVGLETALQRPTRKLQTMHSFVSRVDKRDCRRIWTVQ